MGIKLTIWTKWQFSGHLPRDATYRATRFGLLELAAGAAPETGDWLEFGVFNGGSVNYLANLCGHEIYGFDSFEGLPRGWSPRVPAGSFSTKGILPQTAPNVRLIRGWFEATLPEFVRSARGRKVAFIHIDCDLYESARFVLDCLGSLITPGTVIVFDEFAGPLPDDEARAFRDFVRLNHREFDFIGCSGTGSVAVRITA